MNAPTLVLLHPIGLDGASFIPLGLENALAPDLLGHGSRPRSAGMTLQDLARDVADNCPGQLDVVGISLGAIVGLHLALERPERVRSLVVACCFGAWADPSIAEQRAREAERGIQGVVGTTLERYFTAEALTSGHPGVHRARAALSSMDPFAYADGWRAMAGHDVRSRLGQLTMPVTCVAGSQDLAVRPERLEEVARAVPVGRFVMIEAPHMAHLEQPARFRATIEEHLRLLPRD